MCVLLFAPKLEVVDDEEGRDESDDSETGTERADVEEPSLRTDMAESVLTVEELSNIIAELSKLAAEKGASCHPIYARDVVVADWVRFKCEFGCKGYAKRLNCPPYTPSAQETRQMLSSYSHALLVHFENVPGFDTEHGEPINAWHSRLLRKLSLWVHDTMFELERSAFLMGAYRTLALGAYPCEYCDECVVMTHEGLDEPALKRLCPHKDKLRPSMEACGIDVFTTVRHAQLPLHTIKKRAPNGMAASLNSYGVLLLD